MQDKNKREEASFYIKSGALIIGGLWVLGAGSDLLVKKETSIDLHNKKYSDYSTPLASHALNWIEYKSQPWGKNNDLCTIKLKYSIENTGQLKLIIDTYRVEVFEINKAEEADLSKTNVVDFSISKLISDSKNDRNTSYANSIFEQEYVASEVIGHENKFERSIGYVIKRDSDKFYTIVINASGGIWTGKEIRTNTQSFQPTELQHVSETIPICEVKK